MKRRILSLVLIISLLISAAVRPQRAGAVVATTAAVAASAAAILTACGVSYWAATQTDAIDYIGSKIGDYLASIDEPDISYEEWLEIDGTSQLFDVVAGGVMRFGAGVANKLLDFCRWLQDDEGIESGGETVGDLGILSTVVIPSYATLNGSIIATVVSSDEIYYSFNTSAVSPRTAQMYIPVEPDKNYTIVVDELNDNTNTVKQIHYSAVSSPNSMPSVIGRSIVIGKEYTVNADASQSWLYIYFSVDNNVNDFDAYITIDGAQLKSDDKAVITPSEFVNIPSDIDSDAVFAVKPSVSLSSGDTVDDATETILEGITSEEGLSSAVEDTPDTSWGWLYTLLVNIAEAITDGVADIKQAVLGLADSIFNKFTTVLQDIKTGISTIVNSITSAVSQLLSAIQSLPTTIYSQFTQILQDIKTGIQGIALDIYTDVINALTYVFVPSQTFIDTYVASLYATFDNHFSILSYPFSILGEFITRASGIGSPEPMFTWGNIYEPFSGKLLIAAGSYNLNSMLSNQTFAQVYSIYMIVVKGLISFAFLKFLYSWFCDVFKMREDDFSSPFDVEVEDDGADFDGYDGYYTS